MKTQIYAAPAVKGLNKNWYIHNRDFTIADWTQIINNTIIV